MTEPDRLRRLAAVLVAAWLTLSIAMTVVATVNFKDLKPDRLRDARRVFAPLGDEAAQTVALRYTASELNRHLFDLYGKGQLVLGLLAMLVLLAARSGVLTGLLGALALLAALAFAFWLVPAIVEQGRVIDFMPRQPPNDDLLAFDRLHRISVRVEGGKMIALLIALVLLVTGRRRPIATAG